MNFIRLSCAAVVCALLSSCAAMEAENNSPTPIPPARPNPFVDSFGSSTANPENIGGSAPLGN